MVNWIMDVDMLGKDCLGTNMKWNLGGQVQLGTTYLVLMDKVKTISATHFVLKNCILQVMLLTNLNMALWIGLKFARGVLK